MVLHFRELAAVIDQETQTTTKPPCSCVSPSSYPTAVSCGGPAQPSSASLDALRRQLRESLGRV